MGAVEGGEALSSFVELDEFEDSDEDEPPPAEESPPPPPPEEEVE